MDSESSRARACRCTVGRNIPNLKMCQCEDITFGRKNVLRIPSNVAQNGSLDRASIMCKVCDDHVQRCPASEATSSVDSARKK